MVGETPIYIKLLVAVLDTFQVCALLYQFWNKKK